MKELAVELSTTGARKCLGWLVFCKSIGWKAEDMPYLQDLWCTYRDRNGNLKSRSLPDTEGKK